MIYIVFSFGELESCKSRSPNNSPKEELKYRESFLHQITQANEELRFIRDEIFIGRILRYTVKSVS